MKGDRPIKVAKEFSQDLAVPEAMIFNQIVETGQ